MNALKPLSLATTSAIYFLIVIGGYVSSSGAGLSCPDWPLCHGRLIPPLSGSILVEYVHRLSALVATFLVLATALYAWKRFRNAKGVLVASTLCLGILVVQILVGALTVQSGLDPLVSTAHLGFATAVFGAALATALLAYRVHD